MFSFVSELANFGTTEAEKKEAMRIAEDSHEFIRDEIQRRERLEHDHSRVFVAADEEPESDED